MKILGIETSCDDTCVAILDGPKCLSHLFASQDHNRFGGILPEYAARNHMTTLPKLVECSLLDAKVALGDIDVIGVTYAPGLLGSLMVGTSYAKGLSWSLGCKFIGVHHIEGHILAAQYDCGIEFPYGALVISGGHTLIAIAEGLGHYTLLGSSLDDAAGECFDKVARELGLSQPGGPAIEALARDGKANIPLPNPLHNDNTCNFSFSGLKTAAIKAAKDACHSDLAASLQHAIATTLSERLSNAILLRPDITNWALVGGVAANRYIFSMLHDSVAKYGCKLYCPSIKLCTDNGVMIAYAAKLYAEEGRFSDLNLQPKGTLRL